MKRLCRWAVVCACVAVAGGVAGFAVRLAVAPWRLQAKLASELDPSDPSYRKVMCGPVSLSVALGRLGVSTTASVIASQCRVTSSGVALTDLERVGASLPTISAAAGNLHWEDLQAVDGVAVLFVKGDHYVAADPREALSEARERTVIRVYDRDVPARWYSRAELEEIWSGEALVITKRQTPPDVQGDARITWDECYVDKGVLADTPIASFEFSLRNEGGRDLFIEGVETSCGCIEHRLSTEQLAPGESAQLAVDVNLDGKQGYVQQYVIAKTNDPANPMSFLKMACGVPRSRLVSTQVIRLEDLPQGGNVRQEFVVADPGFTGMAIRDASFLSRGSSRSADDLSCSIFWETIGENVERVKARTGFSASPRDYLVRLSFSAGNACPPGPFEGDVMVTVEADGSVATHKVDIQGMIVQDVRSVPRMALITLGPDPESVGSATVQLQSEANREITVVKTWSDGTHSLEIRPARGLQAGKSSYVVTARMPDLVVGAAPFTGTALFELDDGSVVSVPVTVFRPPQ